MTREADEPREADGLNLRGVATDALRFWERGRLVYNAVLIIVVAALLAARPPGSANDILTLDGMLILCLAAVAANVLYSLAYVVDIFVQLTAFAEPWRRWRWGLLALGTTTAAILARFTTIAMLQGHQLL